MGDATFTAYSKITAEGKLQQKAWLKNDRVVYEISTTHFLLCIEPIVFGVWLPFLEGSQNINKAEPFVIYLGGRYNGTEFQRAEAKMFVQPLEILEEPGGSLILLKLLKSRIYHLNWLKRYLLFYRYYRDRTMPYLRFKSFVCGYSYPRRVRVVCFKQGDYYNIFPMDLLGDLHDEGRYVFGLRHSNIALQKIISAGKIVVCEFSCQYKDIVYELGKHHSGSPPCLESLAFQTFPSKSFGFPVPAWVDSYTEVKISKTINLGSHMLLWGHRVDEVVFEKPSRPLYLVHFLHYLHHQHSVPDYKLA